MVQCVHSMLDGRISSRREEEGGVKFYSHSAGCAFRAGLESLPHKVHCGTTVIGDRGKRS